MAVYERPPEELVGDRGDNEAARAGPCEVEQDSSRPAVGDEDATVDPEDVTRVEPSVRRSIEPVVENGASSEPDTVIVPSTVGTSTRRTWIPEPELVGRTLGRFEVVRSLGRGGMGFVYEVFDPERELRLALKRLIQVDGGHILRFKREFRALRDLRHPNLVALDELFEHEGHWCFTMELVPGVDLLSYVRGIDPPDDVAESSPTRIVDPSSTGSSRSSRSGARGASLRGVRAGASEDVPRAHLSRLRRSLVQLTLGLQHLHRAGKVHRDVKPSNILVTSKGRVVLLDLGVVGELEDERPEEGEIVGTYAYMAPEQRRGNAVGPAADWYSVGVLLYQALTGRRFRGNRPSATGPQVESGPVPDLSDFPPDQDSELVSLCRRLLRVEPEERAGAAEILQVLGEGSGDAAQKTFSSWWAEGTFVGRDAELSQLRTALQASASTQSIVLVEGESGIGKSALVQTFVRRIRRTTPELLVLQGRCHERERLPYNALDGVVDGLGRWMSSLGQSEVEALADADVLAMMKIFPTLRAVGELARIEASRSPSGKRDDARTRAFAGLRKLLVEVGERHRLLVVLDDVQWADGDSLTLLDELTSGAGTPRWLLVCLAQRPQGREACRVMQRLAPRASSITLEPLTASDASVLTRRLVERLPETVRSWARAVTREAAGHPMFIEQLVQHALTADPDQGALPKLEDAVRRRADGLGPQAKAVLVVVAAAAAPVEHRVAMTSSGLTPTDYAESVGALVAARLARVGGSRELDTIETYHDKIRRSIYEELNDAHRRDVHRSIADALVGTDGDPDAIAVHYAHTDEHDATVRYALLAAERASAALAFDRAAQLYELVLSLEIHDADERRELYVGLGDALAEAGRPEASATAYEQAIECGARGAERLELRRRVAHQLLGGGYIDRGLEAARGLLEEIGETLPRRDAAFMVRLLYHGLRSRLSSLDWEPTRAEELPEEALTRMDVEWSVGAGLSMVDTLRGAMFFARAPRLCLKYGEPFRVCRAFSAASVSASVLGQREQAARFVEATQDAAARTDHPLAPFYTSFAVHGKAFLVDNDWTSSKKGSLEAVEMWRSAGRGRGWEFDVLQQFYCWSVMMLGEYAELQRAVPALIRTAQRTGNRFLEVSLRTFFPMLWLFADQPEEARRDLDEALAMWIPAERSFGNQHYWAVRSFTHIACYQRQVERDAERVECSWARVVKSLVGRVEVMQLETAIVYGDWLLLRAEDARHRGERTQMQGFLKGAERCIRQLKRSPLPGARPSQVKLAAAVAWLRGDPETAAELLRATIRECEVAQTWANLAGARYRLGRVLGGDEGAELVSAGLEYLQREQVRNPERLAVALYPGWELSGRDG